MTDQEQLALRNRLRVRMFIAVQAATVVGATGIVYALVRLT